MRNGREAMVGLTVNSEVETVVPYRTPRAGSQSLFLVGSGLLPVVVATALVPQWFLPKPGVNDPWYYWGFAQDRDYFQTFFSQTYYVRRWTLIWPLEVLRPLDDVLVELAIYRGISFAITSAALSWVSYRILRARVIALIPVLVIASTPWMMFSVGDPLHTGTGLMLWSLCMVIITSDLQPSRWWANFALGILLALLFITYPFTAWLALATGAYVFVGRRLAGEAGPSARSVLRASVWLGFGFVLGLLADRFVNVSRGLEVDWILAYSLRTGRGLASAGWITPPVTALSELFVPPMGWGLSAATLAVLVLILGRAESQSLLRSQPLQRLAALTLLTVASSGVAALLGGGVMRWPWTSIHLAVMTVLLALSAALQCATRWSSETIRAHDKVQAMRRFWPALALFGIALTANRYATPPSPRTVTLLAWLGLVTCGAALLRKVVAACDSPLVTPRQRTIRVLAAVGSLLLVLDVTVAPVSAEPPIDYRRRIGSSYPSYAVAAGFLQGLRDEVRAITTSAGVERRVWLVDFRESVGGVDTSRSSPLEKALLDGYARLKTSTGGPVCEWLPMIVDVDSSVVIVTGSGDATESSERLAQLLAPCGELDVVPSADVDIGPMYAFNLRSNVG